MIFHEIPIVFGRYEPRCIKTMPSLVKHSRCIHTILHTPGARDYGNALRKFGERSYDIYSCEEQNLAALPINPISIYAFAHRQADVWDILSLGRRHMRPDINLNHHIVKSQLLHTQQSPDRFMRRMFLELLNCIAHCFIRETDVIRLECEDLIPASSASGF